MNIGILRLSEQFLLDTLDFEGGTIRNIRINPEYSGTIDIVLEHPDMPETEDGSFFITVRPAYRGLRRVKGEK